MDFEDATIGVVFLKNRIALLRQNSEVSDEIVSIRRTEAVQWQQYGLPA